MNIVWQRPDGSVAVTTLYGDDDPKGHAKDLQKRGDIPKDWVAVSFAVKDFPHDLPLEVLAVKDGKAALHVERARNWRKTMLRRDRAPALAALDTVSLRNQESGADNTHTLKAKQELRDITKKVDVLNTWPQMMAVTIPQGDLK